MGRLAAVLLLFASLPSCTAGGGGPRLQHLPGKHRTARTVVLGADVACPPEQSYRMWTTEAGVKSFFAPDARIEGTVGGRYTMMFFPADDPEGLLYGTAGARLLAAEPGRFIAFEWVVFAGDETKGDHAPPYAPPGQRLPAPLPTWVEIALAPAGAGTHVEFRHYGFGEGPLWGRSHSWFRRAWAGVLVQMKAACGRGPAGP